MVNGEADQDSIENAVESMSPRQRRDWVSEAVRQIAAKGRQIAAKLGEADEHSED